MYAGYQDRLHRERMLEMQKNPPTFNKNSQGEYRFVLKLGESPQVVNQRNPNLFKMDDVGHSSKFYHPILPFSEIPKIRVELLGEDYHPVLDFINAKDIMLVSDASYPELGISDMTLDFQSATDCDEKTNNNCTQEAISKRKYHQYAQTIAMLKKFGWKPYIPLIGYKDEAGYARVTGEISWRLDSSDRFIVNKDGYYMDSYEKWQKYVPRNDVFVQFYKDNLILDLVLGDALSYLNITTNNDSYFFRYDEFTRAEKWREYLAADIPKWQAKRKQAEDELRAKGYHIDETYIDAPLPK